MQVSQARIRHTPFGDCYEHMPVRLNPFDAQANQERSRRAPRLSAAELVWVHPQLALLEATPDMLLGKAHPAIAPDGTDLYHAALQLSWNLARLALAAASAPLVHGTRLGISAALASRRTRH